MDIYSSYSEPSARDGVQDILLAIMDANGLSEAEFLAELKRKEKESWAEILNGTGLDESIFAE